MRIKIIISWILSMLIIISGVLVLKNNYAFSHPLNKFVHIKVIGAVVSKRTVTLPMKSTMYDLVSKVVLTPAADRGSINWKLIFVNDQTVTFKRKVKLKKIIVNNKTKIEDLNHLEIPNKLKKRLLEYFKQNKRWSWESIDLLHGVGLATLKLLKEQLDISYGI